MKIKIIQKFTVTIYRTLRLSVLMEIDNKSAEYKNVIDYDGV